MAAIRSTEKIEPTHGGLPSGETVRVEAARRCAWLIAASRSTAALIWWNFVSSSRERVVEAAARWDADHSPRIPGETEWVPLPGSPSFLP